MLPHNLRVFSWALPAGVRIPFCASFFFLSFFFDLWFSFIFLVSMLKKRCCASLLSYTEYVCSLNCLVSYTFAHSVHATVDHVPRSSCHPAVPWRHILNNSLLLRSSMLPEKIIHNNREMVTRSRCPFGFSKPLNP